MIRNPVDASLADNIGNASWLPKDKGKEYYICIVASPHDMIEGTPVSLSWMETPTQFDLTQNVKKQCLGVFQQCFR